MAATQQASRADFRRESEQEAAEENVASGRPKREGRGRAACRFSIRRVRTDVFGAVARCQGRPAQHSDESAGPCLNDRRLPWRQMSRAGQAARAQSRKYLR